MSGVAWPLDPSVTFLNHGSFGACPVAVLAEQQRWRERMERNPVRFLATEAHQLEAEFDRVRGVLGGFLGADPDDLAFVTNATTGVNTVLRSVPFRPGDEILTTNHVYNACGNAIATVARERGALVRIADVPFPPPSDAAVLDAVLAATGPRTRLAVLDHVTSPTALVLPIEALVRELQSRGVDVLVDGAHAPGMLPLDLGALGAAYYTGNCHKWMCAPKGSAFLHVRRDRQGGVRPLIVSHGANDPRTDRSRFRLEFDWTGTSDPTPWLSIPAAIETMERALPGGWPAVMAGNHDLAVEAGDVLARTFSSQAPTTTPPPIRTIGSMVAITIPETTAALERVRGLQGYLSDELVSLGYEVPIIVWPVPWAIPAGVTEHRLLVRVSAQLYNRLEQYERLGVEIVRLMKRPPEH